MASFTVSDFRAAMRRGKYAWPGGYPLYFVMSDGAPLSFEAARKNCRAILDAIRNKDGSGWRIVAVDVNWDNPDLYCEDTGKQIESAYAETEDAP